MTTGDDDDWYAEHVKARRQARSRGQEKADEIAKCPVFVFVVGRDGEMSDRSKALLGIEDDQ